jgi:hypothetical protein
MKARAYCYCDCHTSGVSMMHTVACCHVREEDAILADIKSVQNGTLSGSAERMTMAGLKLELKLAQDRAPKLL